MTKRLKNEFDSFVCDILNNDKFLETKKDLHHGTSKYEHSLRVAKLSYKLGKIFKADDYFIRPAQDCNRSYGRGIVLQKVGFDNGKLIFQELKRFYPASWRYPLGLHTLNVEEHVVVVDGLGFRKPIVGYILERLREIMRLLK